MCGPHHDFGQKLEHSSLVMGAVNWNSWGQINPKDQTPPP